jgi:hypothetical protein
VKTAVCKTGSGPTQGKAQTKCSFPQAFADVPLFAESYLLAEFAGGTAGSGVQKIAFFEPFLT